MENTTNFIMKPKVDFCFKELMEFEEVRQGFIAAVLGIEPEEVIKTELLPTHLRVRHNKDKLGILDVRVILNGDVQLDMEIQVAKFLFWRERSLFYLSKMYMKQIRKGQDYDVLQKCTHVRILDFDLFKNGEYYSGFHMWEDLRKELYSDKLEIQAIRDHNNIISSGWVRGCEREGKKECA